MNCRMLVAGLSLLGGLPLPLLAQIDPVKRDLLEAGYQQAFEGHGPFPGYGYYYMNRPEFLEHTNLALRLAIAPVYLDGELGVRNVLPDTDLGLGINGGGFAYDYYEVRQGKYYHEESFIGHGGGVSVSLYHLLNPGAMIPLTAVLRGVLPYTFYERDDLTAPNFKVPDALADPTVRAGFRWGGQEPVLAPNLAMEVSGWYEGQFRLDAGPYGYNGDRQIEPVVHLFWGRTAFIYTFPELRHRIELHITGGGSVHPDRFSAYRLGGMLDLASEFPFDLPGYYFQELSARNFVLMGGSYSVPLDKADRLELSAGGVTGSVAYTPGDAQPGNWNSGVSGTLTYNSPARAWKLQLSYGYGFDAIRSHGRGANSVALLMQLDLAKSGADRPNWNQFNRGNFIQRLLEPFEHW